MLREPPQDRHRTHTPNRAGYNNEGQWARLIARNGVCLGPWPFMGHRAPDARKGGCGPVLERQPDMDAMEESNVRSLVRNIPVTYPVRS